MGARWHSRTWGAEENVAHEALTADPIIEAILANDQEALLQEVMAMPVGCEQQSEDPTSNQIRAARAVVCLGQKELSAECGVNYQIIAKYEKTGVIAKRENLQKMRAALEQRGIFFRDPKTHWVSWSPDLVT